MVPSRVQQLSPRSSEQPSSLIEPEMSRKENQRTLEKASEPCQPRDTFVSVLGMHVLEITMVCVYLGCWNVTGTQGRSSKQLGSDSMQGKETVALTETDSWAV